MTQQQQQPRSPWQQHGHMCGKEIVLARQACPCTQQYNTATHVDLGAKMWLNGRSAQWTSK
jgi:hypothetical protein